MRYGRKQLAGTLSSSALHGPFTSLKEPPGGDLKDIISGFPESASIPFCRKAREEVREMGASVGWSLYLL